MKKIILLLGCFLLAACTSAAPSAPFPAGLSVEEHALTKRPEAEYSQLDFAQGSQEAILAVRAAERAQAISPLGGSCTVDNRLALCASLGPDQLAAWADDPADPLAPVSVTVTRNGQLIYRVPVGNSSPIGSLRGLWTYAGHWALETAYVTNRQTGNEIDSQAAGQITVDGILLNRQSGYQEAFGFQLLDGKPFYFSKQDDKINANYDGQQIPLGYDELPHYNCCSAATLNPKMARNMVAFFARRGGTWYYVELGAFGRTTP